MLLPTQQRVHLCVLFLKFPRLFLEGDIPVLQIPDLFVLGLQKLKVFAVLFVKLRFEMLEISHETLDLDDFVLHHFENLLVLFDLLPLDLLSVSCLLVLYVQIIVVLL